MIMVPYYYMTWVIHAYIHEHDGVMAGPGYTEGPKLKDLWISMVSGLVIYHSMHYLQRVLAPILYSWAKVPEDETPEMAAFKAKKAGHNAYKLLWHSFAAAGSYYCIAGKDWLPWFFGGDGVLANGFVNMPFTPLDRTAYIFGLILLGHPL